MTGLTGDEAEGRDSKAGRSIQPVRPSAGDSVVEAIWMGCELQEGGEDIATGGVEGACETAQERKAVAE